MSKASSMESGDAANNTHIQTTTHVGTHLDMPYHFFNDGQTIANFDANFWVFNQPLIIEITPEGYIAKDELIQKLPNNNDLNYDILIVKTGMCNKRNTPDYGEKNTGFSPDLADIIRSKFPTIRVFGFDSISVSSFQERMIGRDAHRAFLNPTSPIILLEDMDLNNISENSKFEQLIIAPLRIESCDGIPCTVIGAH